MAENDPITAGSASADEGRQLVLQKVYLRDCSFESPNSPQTFSVQWEPKVSLNMQTSTRNLGNDSWEVVLHVTLEAKVAEETAFLCEVQQAGFFLIQGFTEDDRKRLLGGYCPGIVFPYAREVISDLVGKGGFPQLLLQPVNFDALFAKHEQDMAQAAAEAAQAPDRH